MRRFESSFPAATSSLSKFREELGEWLVSNGEAIGDWPLIATELFSNAVAASARAGSIDVMMERQQDELVLCVANDGPDFELSSPPSPVSPQSIRGRGLPIVDWLTDRLSSEHRDGRTVVTCARVSAPNLREQSDQR